MSEQQDIFQQTEGKLYWYYETLRKTELMRGNVEKLQAQRISLQAFQHEYLEACAYQGAKGQYSSERVQGKKSIYFSSIDAAYEAIQDMTGEEIPLLFKRQAALLLKISRNEIDMMPVEQAIGYLAKIDKDICEYRYKYKLSFDEIARSLNLSRGAVRHRRVKIVRCISERLAGA